MRLPYLLLASASVVYLTSLNSPFVGKGDTKTSNTTSVQLTGDAKAKVMMPAIQKATLAAVPPQSDNPLFPNGSLNATEYRKLASNLSSEEMIKYRYGKTYKDFYPSSTQAFPTQCEASHKVHEVKPNLFINYELGSVDSSKDDYSTTDGQFLHIADDAAKDPGVYHFTPLLMSKGIFVESPQPSWQYYGGIYDNAFGAQNNLNQAGVALNGGPIRQPVAMARGHVGWSEDALVLFNSGLIGTAGTFTGRTYKYLRLPANKRPISIAVTNHNEFALVLVWDTNTLKSQIAVLALASGPFEKKAGQTFWGDWVEVYPGLTNYGMYQFIKVLGYVDLPGIAAATEISAASDFDIFKGLPYAGWYANHKQPADLTLSIEANRQTFIGEKFIDNTNIGAYAKAGFAVVSAPAERKVAFIDLKPLFAYVERMYFSSRENFEKTKTYGLSSTQWPYTFDVASDFAPTVVKVIDLENRPTAVKAHPLLGQAYVATEDGTLHMYDVGVFAGRHASADTKTSREIRKVNSIQVGKNPTSIAHMKLEPTRLFSTTADRPRDALIVVSRGDRRIDWVRVNGNQATIDRTLRDSRLIDPIAVEDADNHGTESYVLSVADYGGKQIANYRYGPVIFHTNGGKRFNMCGPFEFGGTWKIPGKPFSLSVNNTP